MSNETNTTTTTCDCNAEISAALSNSTKETTTEDNNNNNNEEEEIITLKLLTLSFMKPELEKFAITDFTKKFSTTTTSNQKINIQVLTVPTFADLYNEIETNARLSLGVVDLYITPPSILGTAVRLDGFYDMTSFVQEHYLEQWLDIFSGYRDIISSYEGRIYMVPLDGDVLNLYYNKEILREFGLAVPRTWEEYNEVASAVHGKEWGGKRLVGSCVGRRRNCAGSYWAMLVLSSMTQRMGSFEGSLLDSKDLGFLLGEGFEEMLRIFEGQVRFGNATEELAGCIGEVNIPLLESSTCALTYNWGNSFKGHLVPPSTIANKLGIAPTPGSRKVLNRATGKLELCTRKTCPNAEYYEDIGFVNMAPYAAFGGWSGAVNAHAAPHKQELAMEFLTFAASREESAKLIVPNATSPEASTGYDPFRISHLDVDEFVANGYERELTEEYRRSILESLQSPNLVTDIRFSQAGAITGVLDREVHNHLEKMVVGEVVEEEVLAASRQNALQNITDEWNNIITKYDERGDTDMKILEQYQRLRGVYTSENEDLNQIDNIRWFGWTLAGIIVILCIGFAAWVMKNRRIRVVRVSQPFFLITICFGTLVFGSAIFPLGVDDSMASQNGCNVACMSAPWLLSTGFTIIFAALFSKIWRINKIFHGARFKRITVQEKDVAVPFCVLFGLNVALLLAWTFVDPLKWERVQEDELNSYGICTAEGTAWKGFLASLAVVNAGALILANVQAYIARNIKDEFSESKYIGIAMASMLQISIIGAPLLALVDNDPSARFFVWTGIIFVICTSILLLIFVPKVVMLWKDQRKRNEKQGSNNNPNAPTFGNFSSVNSDDPNKQASIHGPKLTTSTLATLQGPPQNKAFADKNSELLYREKISQLKMQVQAEHGVDIGPLLSQIGLFDDGERRKTEDFVDNDGTRTSNEP